MIFGYSGNRDLQVPAFFGTKNALFQPKVLVVVLLFTFSQGLLNAEDCFLLLGFSLTAIMIDFRE